MDANGYPEEHELKKISGWPHTDFPGLIEHIRARWLYADCGYFAFNGSVLEMSTGGWSGNESIIYALKENHIFWWHCLSWRRGGHYVFDGFKKGNDGG